MVDADAVHAPVGEELPEKLVRRLEYLRPLDVQPGQRVHVEEPPVVDLVRRGAPVRQPIRLRLEQLVQGIEARRVAGDSVHASRPRRRCAGQPPVRPAPACPAAPSRLLSRGAAPRFGSGRARCRRQILERAEDALELVDPRAVGAKLAGERLHREPQDARSLPWIDRQFLVEIAQYQRAAAELQLQFSPVQHAARTDRPESAAAVWREAPLSEAPSRCRKTPPPVSWAILEHVGPPRISPRADPHVVRDEIDDVLHLRLARSPRRTRDERRLRPAQD